MSVFSVGNATTVIAKKASATPATAASRAGVASRFQQRRSAATYSAKPSAVVTRTAAPTSGRVVGTGRSACAIDDQRSSRWIRRALGLASRTGVWDSTKHHTPTVAASATAQPPSIQALPRSVIGSPDIATSLRPWTTSLPDHPTDMLTRS